MSSSSGDSVPSSMTSPSSSSSGRGYEEKLNAVERRLVALEKEETVLMKEWKNHIDVLSLYAFFTCMLLGLYFGLRILFEPWQEIEQYVLYKLCASLILMAAFVSSIISAINVYYLDHRISKT